MQDADSQADCCLHRQRQGLLAQLADEIIAAIPMGENVGDELRKAYASFSCLGLRFVVDRLGWPAHDQFPFAFMWLSHAATLTWLSDRQRATRRVFVMFSWVTRVIRSRAENFSLTRFYTCVLMRIWMYGLLMIWSLVHTKGGVAKTTTCMFLAAAAARRDVPVRVVDADPQGSASSWADRAAHLGTPLPFDVTPATAANLRELSSEPNELILVDTPPGTAAAIDAAIDAADLVIIPTGPRAADIDRVWPTLDITAHRPTTVLLTLVDMRKIEAVEMPRSLIEANAPVLRNIVRGLIAVERAFGRGIPRYLGDYGDVFDELMASVGLEKEMAL